jgi:hypothetical protein
MQPNTLRSFTTLTTSGNSVRLRRRAVSRLQEIYKAYRSRLHRLALDGQPPFAAGTEFFDERAYVSAIWERQFGDTEEAGSAS